MANKEIFIEEKFIEETLGRKNPYRVPEGYFDRFAEHIISKLPERQEVQTEQETIQADHKAAKAVRQTRLKALRPILIAAACLCIAIFSITFYFDRTPQNTEKDYISAVAGTDSNTEEDEVFMDEAADYAMLDNADIYACLSE